MVAPVGMALKFRVPLVATVSAAAKEATSAPTWPSQVSAPPEGPDRTAGSTAVAAGGVAGEIVRCGQGKPAAAGIMPEVVAHLWLVVEAGWIWGDGTVNGVSLLIGSTGPGSKAAPGARAGAVGDDVIGAGLISISTRLVAAPVAADITPGVAD